MKKKNISGGLCRSWKRKGFIIDTGPHIFHTPDELLKKILEKKFWRFINRRKKFSCKNVKGKNFDKFYDYPLSNEGLKQFEKNLQSKIKNEIKKCNKKDQRYKAKNYKEYIDSLLDPP